MKKITLYFILGFGLNSYCQTPGGGITDIDGNTYNSVIIGAQEWTKENLNVSKYSDGTPIPEVADPTQWENLTTGAWCYYNNTTANGTTYGKLYNWYAVAGIYNSASFTNPVLRKKLAPAGWHIPSDDEWTVLTTYLGGKSVAGGKMKESGTVHWESPNTGATNSSGFTSLPGGQRRLPNGLFAYLGTMGCYWTASETDATHAWFRYLYHNNILVSGGGAAGLDLKFLGLSVRLVNNTLLDNQSIKNNSFNIYPNPAIDNVVIDLGNLTIVSNWSYKITNTLGQEVIKGKISSQQTTINLNDIKSKGMYFVKIYDASNNVVETKKLIIK